MKKDYMARLERWARWYLPRQEAEDVLADYRDIVGNPPRPDGELLRNLGRPRSVIRPLAQKKLYGTWLAVFGVMAACILLPAASQFFFGAYRLFRPFFPWAQLFSLAGTILILVWPRRGEGNAPLPRAIPVTLAALLVPVAFPWWIFRQLTLFPGGALANPFFHLSVYVPVGLNSCSGNMLHILLALELLPLAAAGMTGLVKARIRDRRWRAVYTLSLSGLLLTLHVISLLTNMDPSPEPLFTGALPAMIEITAVGLLGTGVALC